MIISHFICEFVGAQIRRYADTQIRRYADTQICRYADKQICRYADKQICRYADTQIGVPAMTSNHLHEVVVGFTDHSPPSSEVIQAIPKILAQ